MVRARTRHALLTGAVVALLVLTAHIGYLHSVTYFGDPPAPVVTTPESPDPLPSGDGGSDPVLRRHPARGEPVVVRIPVLNIDATVRPVASSDDGSLSPPASIWEVGWWSGGALPGSARGTVLMTAHSYRGDGGVFGHLGDLEPGDWVRVLTRTGTVDYRVDGLLDLSEDEFSDQAEELLAADARGRLVLVTCGRYHFGHYDGRTVVNATMVPKD